MNFELTASEKQYFISRLRNARYLALADSEGFESYLFVLEELGMRLIGREAVLNEYGPAISKLSRKSITLNEMSKSFPSIFTGFDALFYRVRKARNDRFHVGAYARHATQAAIELGIGLEEALLIQKDAMNVGELMVKNVVVAEPWHLVSQARMVILRDSFSFLPLYLNGHWYLLSDLALAKFLAVERDVRVKHMALSIEAAAKQEPHRLELISIPDNTLLNPGRSSKALLRNMSLDEIRPWLWLVVEGTNNQRLCGVLSPFEFL